MASGRFPFQLHRAAAKPVDALVQILIGILGPWAADGAQESRAGEDALGFQRMMPGAVQSLEKHVGVVLVQLDAGVFDRDPFLGRDRDAFRLLLGLKLTAEDLTFFAVNAGKERGSDKRVWPPPARVRATSAAE